jgi:hypothetical protein
MDDFVCHKCQDTGFITVRNTFPMSYVCAGPPPEDARGVCESVCMFCDPIGIFRAEEE